jgi:hypothetical protein
MKYLIIVLTLLPISAEEIKKVVVPKDFGIKI